MAKILDQIKAKLPLKPPPSPVTFVPPPAPTSEQTNNPTHTDIYRYRYQHGTNLGSVFVLEKWLFGSMFPRCKDDQSSELEAVKATVKDVGLPKARSRFEEHWKAQVDWDWLTGDARCTAIRLPIGYFTLGKTFTKGTPFEKFASVYENAWSIVKDFIRTAASHRIGILVDMHALPGGANTSDHSGTNSRKAELWDSRAHRDLAIKAITYVVQDLKVSNLTNIIGVSACNEAAMNAADMYGYYDSILAATNPIDQHLPLYISDAWDLTPAVQWALSKNTKTTLTNPIVIDSHYYWAFSDADKAKTPQQIIDDVKTKFTELDGQEGSIHDRGGVQVAVGEYSCVMAGEVWQRHPANRDSLVRTFGQEQTRRYQERASGAFFWTLKMDWMDGGEWGFVEQSNKGAITAPKYLSLPHTRVPDLLRSAREQKDALKSGAAREHAQFWDTQYPDGSFEHWRFEPGWVRGWTDAETFFVAKTLACVQSTSGDGSIDPNIVDKLVHGVQQGVQQGVQNVAKLLGLSPAAFPGIKGRKPDEGVDRIGARELWTLKRVRESGMAGSEWCWEWEAGLRKGMEDFERLVGIREG